MVDLANRAQVLGLIEECENQKGQLTSNEFEMYQQIKTKYSDADEGSFDDKICLELMLRNIGIRKGMNMNKSEATRIIDTEKKT